MKDASSGQSAPVEQKALLETLLQMTLDHKMHERFYTARDFQWAADLRRQANRLATVAERLESITQDALEAAGGTKSVLETDAPFTLTMPADRLYAEAHFWRSRVLADMLPASSYYMVTAQMISLAMKTLDKCSCSMKAGEIALLLDHASALLADAAKFIGTAGVELADNDVRWENLKDAVKQL